MAYNWMAGADYSPDGNWNAYNSYAGGGGYQQPYTGGFVGNSAVPKDTTGGTANSNGSLYGALVGADQYNNGASSATGGAITGAANGYAQGGWMGAVVGGISGYFGGKDNEEKAKRNPDLEVAKFNAENDEKIRQLKIQETKDAMSKYTNGLTPNTFNYTNGLFGSGKPSGNFMVQPPTQPIVNPEQNGYGLLRG